MTKTELIELLKDTRKVLSYAFFADYKLQNKSDAICFKIDEFLKEVKEDNSNEKKRIN